MQQISSKTIIGPISNFKHKISKQINTNHPINKSPGCD